MSAREEVIKYERTIQSPTPPHTHSAGTTSINGDIENGGGQKQRATASLIPQENWTPPARMSTQRTAPCVKRPRLGGATAGVTRVQSRAISTGDNGGAGGIQGNGSESHPVVVLSSDDEGNGDGSDSSGGSGDDDAIKITVAARTFDTAPKSPTAALMLRKSSPPGPQMIIYPDSSSDEDQPEDDDDDDDGDVDDSNADDNGDDDGDAADDGDDDGDADDDGDDDGGREGIAAVANLEITVGTITASPTTVDSVAPCGILPIFIAAETKENREVSGQRQQPPNKRPEQQTQRAAAGAVIRSSRRGAKRKLECIVRPRSVSSGIEYEVQLEGQLDTCTVSRSDLMEMKVSENCKSPYKSSIKDMISICDTIYNVEDDLHEEELEQAYHRLSSAIAKYPKDKRLLEQKARVARSLGKTSTATVSSSSEVSQDDEDSSSDTVWVPSSVSHNSMCPDCPFSNKRTSRGPGRTRAPKCQRCSNLGKKKRPFVSSAPTSNGKRSKPPTGNAHTSIGLTEGTSIGLTEGAIKIRDSPIAKIGDDDEPEFACGFRDNFGRLLLGGMASQLGEMGGKRTTANPKDYIACFAVLAKRDNMPNRGGSPGDSNVSGASAVDTASTVKRWTVVKGQNHFAAFGVIAGRHTGSDCGHAETEIAQSANLALMKTSYGERSCNVRRYINTPEYIYKSKLQAAL